MILGTGIDITETARLEKVLRRFGRRFAEKILAPSELEAMPAHALPYLAGRFAAKEAAVKALGTGFSGGIGPRDIEITRGSDGRPQLRFCGAAAKLAASLGVRRIHLSISHERSVAAAVVILEA